jgi:hypothetical protein
MYRQEHGYHAGDELVATHRAELRAARERDRLAGWAPGQLMGERGQYARLCRVPRQAALGWGAAVARWCAAAGGDVGSPQQSISDIVQPWMPLCLS